MFSIINLCDIQCLTLNGKSPIAVYVRLLSFNQEVFKYELRDKTQKFEVVLYSQLKKNMFIIQLHDMENWVSHPSVGGEKAYHTISV